MKIAVKTSTIALLALSLAAAPAGAQDLASASVGVVAPPPPSQLATKLPAAAPPAINPPSMATPGISVEANVSAAPALAAGDKAEDADKDKENPGDGKLKVPPAVKSVVKKLDKGVDNATLEDLNAAREATARLDMLIELEKRINDLDAIRRERDEKSMAKQIPASALGLGRGGINTLPPPSLAPTPTPTPAPAPAAPVLPALPLELPKAKVEIDKIMGANGRYVAYLKVGDGKSTLVRVGDKISDDSTVTSISERSVVLSKGKEKRTIKFNGVGPVFGRM